MPYFLKDVFEDPRRLEPGDWDISWLDTVKIPATGLATIEDANDLCWQTARATEWIGERMAILVKLIGEAEAEEGRIYWDAIQRSETSAKTSRPLEAKGDAEYIAAKARTSRLKGFMEFFKQKQTAYEKFHFLAKDHVKRMQTEGKMSYVETEFPAVPEGRDSVDTPDIVEDFSLGKEWDNV